MIIKRYLPWIVVGIGVLYCLSSMRPRREAADEMQISRFGGILVLDGGRLKPVDSYAREQMMLLNRRQTYYDEQKNRQDAIRWLVGLLGDGMIRQETVLVIDDPGVIQWYGLPTREDNRYDIREIRDASASKIEQLQAMARIPPEKMTPKQKQIVMVALDSAQRQKTLEDAEKSQKKQGDPDKAPIFRIDNDQVLAILNLDRREGLRYSFREIINRENQSYFNQFLRKAMQARQRPNEKRDLVDRKAMELMSALRIHAGLMSFDGLTIVPNESLDHWKTLREAFGEHPTATTESLERMIRAYAVGDAKTFNKEVETYRAKQAEAYPIEAKKARLEMWFNQFAPFYQCANLYVLVILLAVLSWLVWPDTLSRSAFWLCVVTVSIHTFGLILRMYIQGRPPVVNLYSSAVFIGWGCVLLCLWVEYFYRNGVGSVIGGITGFATMIIAHHLGGSGDTLEMMQAVLDTNFWLATHVTTVTLGYTATFVAGFFAALLIFRMHASTIRNSFVERKPLTTGQTAAFVASVIGFVGLPTMVLLGILGGLLALWEIWDTLPLATLLILAAPVMIAAFVCGTLFVIRRFSPDQDASTLLRPVERMALTAESSRALTGIIYGVVCFATLLSFVGTVLGGIWADQSWGRFWGWDPKENGALLIVVMNALILHARWGGMIKERGLVVLALVGNMITAWSWFGTNQLGVGLHAYGFNSTLADGCAAFWVSQLVLIGLAMLPLRYYRLYVPTPVAVKPEEVMAKAPKIKGQGPRVVPAT